jgi:hypothetical protein
MFVKDNTSVPGNIRLCSAHYEHFDFEESELNKLGIELFFRFKLQDEGEAVREDAENALKSIKEMELKIKIKE